MIRSTNLPLSAILLFVPSVALAQSAPPEGTSTAPSPAGQPVAPTSPPTAPDPQDGTKTEASIPPDLADTYGSPAGERPSRSRRGFVLGMSLGYALPAGSATG